MLGYEKRKVAIDLLKHLTTLSLGAIAVIASFLQKLVELEKANFSFIISCFLFHLCNFFNNRLFNPISQYRKLF